MISCCGGTVSGCGRTISGAVVESAGVVAGSGLPGSAATSDSRGGGGGSGAGTGVGAVIAIGDAGAIEDEAGEIDELDGGIIWLVKSTAAPPTAIASAASVQCLRDPRSAMRAGDLIG
jgi:hypothetical protein